MTYRWEDAPGLEHHCGVCATPLASSKAKNSCIGVHVEPCPKFHPHLHFVGQSHVCKSCRNSNEAHEMRHREIAGVVLALQAALGVQGDGGRGRGDGGDGGGVGGKQQAMEMDTPMKKRDKKVAKKRAKAATRAKVLTTKDVERIVAILHPSLVESDNQQKTTVATTSELTPHTNLPSTPSPPPRPLRTPATSPPANHLLSPGAIGVTTEVTRILAAFNLPVGTQPPKHLTGAVEKLQKLVREDLEIERNELKYTRQREEGFRCWASRKIEERMKGRWAVEEGGGGMSTTTNPIPRPRPEVSAASTTVAEDRYGGEEKVEQEQWRRVGRAGNTMGAVPTTLKLSRNGASLAPGICNPGLKKGRFGALYALELDDEEVEPPPSPSPSPSSSPSSPPAPGFPSSDNGDSPGPTSLPKIAFPSSYGQLPSLDGPLRDSTTDTTAVADGTDTDPIALPEPGSGKHARRNAARKTRNKAEKLVAFYNLYALAQLPLLLPASILAPDKLPPNIWIVFTASGIVMVDICRCHKEKSGCLYTFKLVADRWGVEVYGAQELPATTKPGEEWGEEKVRRKASAAADAQSWLLEFKGSMERDG